MMLSQLSFGANSKLYDIKVWFLRKCSTVLFSPIAGEVERMEFVSKLDSQVGVTHVVNRTTLYEDVLSLYSKDVGDVISQYPFCVQYKDEIGFDLGGVTRDMYSAFFSEAYVHIFDGTRLLYPATHASVDMGTFSLLGAIISHAYLIAGVFPDRIAFPCLVAILLGPGAAVTDSHLQDYFVGCLSAHESHVLRKALQFSSQKYEPGMQTELASILGCYGCRVLPQPSNLKQLIVQASRYTFSIKPAAAIQLMNAGISVKHRPFWMHMSVGRFHAVYSSLSASPSKVLDLLIEPTIHNNAQEEVWLYLRRFVGNMTVEEVCTFLRFVTGSFVISVPAIKVTYNTSDGLGRRPIGRTCSAVLEISSTYNSFPEFSKEFAAVLSDPYYSWRMDSV